jgi:hypothetical protein
MSNKRSAERRTPGKKWTRKYGSIAVITIITLLTTATMAGIWRNGAAVKRLRAVFLKPPPPPIPSPDHPSKEYIYAGGKLVATEAPVTLTAPLSLVATTASELPPGQVKINISWQATPGADHYEVEKTTNVAANYTSVNPNVAGLTVADTNVTVNPVTAYLYRVRAVDASGNVSPYSNVDVATAISFTDDTLVRYVTPVRAAHITELRRAVDAIRVVTSTLGPADWGPAIVPNETTIQATHIQNLRNNLDAARSALGFPQCTYSDNSVEALRSVYINKDHIDQIRNCVK